MSESCEGIIFEFTARTHHLSRPNKSQLYLAATEQNLKAYLHSEMSTVLEHRTRPARMSDNSINLERKREQKIRMENKKMYIVTAFLFPLSFLSVSKSPPLRSKSIIKEIEEI